MLKTETDLREPLNDLPLVDRFTRLRLRLDHLVQITSIGVLHHDAQVLTWCDKGIFECNNANMVKFLKQVCFLKSLVSFLWAHPRKVY